LQLFIFDVLPELYVMRFLCIVNKVIIIAH